VRGFYDLWKLNTIGEVGGIR